MCTLLVRFDPSAASPVVMAANRDEFRSRPTTDPTDHGDGLFAGRDVRAGGTWLAVTHGRIAAVTNVRGAPPDLEAPSRGLLPLAAIRDELPDDLTRWNGFNLIVASPSALRVLTHDRVGEPVRVRRLPPGDYAIVNDPFGAETARADRATEMLGRLGPGFDALSSHGAGDIGICRHGDEYGTVSATVVAMDRAGEIRDYRHRIGTPCTAPEENLIAAVQRATQRLPFGKR